MPSPFPGMDPYLEGDMWQEFHETMVKQVKTDTLQAWLSVWSCRRYFPECTFEDAKIEIGWDAFQAQKYRAWKHGLALTAAVLWFVAQTTLAWVQMYRRESALAR